MANIGKSISIKGDVLGEEDTVIEGRVEGRVELKNHHLTIGPNGDVQGEVAAKQVTIVGRVSGNVIATERVELRDSGRLEGDLSSPRLLVQEGARLNGKISMPPAGAAAAGRPGKEGAKPEAGTAAPAEKRPA
ncbi:MAG: polymer-forming cytoskeletal protein [Myxococcota bacterium]